MSDEPIIRIPPSDKWIGSCPECGKNIWASYLVSPKDKYGGNIYKCINCGEWIHERDLIPFRPLKL